MNFCIILFPFAQQWDGSIGQWIYMDNHALSGEAGETVKDIFKPLGLTDDLLIMWEKSDG